MKKFLILLLIASSAQAAPYRDAGKYWSSDQGIIFTADCVQFLGEPIENIVDVRNNKGYLKDTSIEVYYLGWVVKVGGISYALSEKQFNVYFQPIIK